MNNTYKEMGQLLALSGFDGISYGTETITNTIMYISMFCPAILIYSKVETIKKLLYSYNVSVTSNSNVEIIIIKII